MSGIRSWPADPARARRSRHAARARLAVALTAVIAASADCMTVRGAPCQHHTWFQRYRRRQRRMADRVQRPFHRPGRVAGGLSWETSAITVRRLNMESPL